MTAFGGSFAVLADVPAGTMYSFGGAFDLLGTGRFANTLGGRFTTLQPPDASVQSFGGSFRVFGKETFTQVFGGAFGLEEVSFSVVRWTGENWLALSESRWLGGNWE